VVRDAAQKRHPVVGEGSMHRFLMYVALSLVLVACKQGASPSAVDEVAQLKARDASLQNALRARDLEAIMEYYAEDAIVMPAAAPMLKGKAAVREEWKHILGIPDFETRSNLTGAEVARSGEIGYTMGTYLATMMGDDGKPVTEPGKWLSIWKKQPDGSWRIAVDIYNTDTAPPDHK
jgi:ketosteroid isomerase-like protein